MAQAPRGASQLKAWLIRAGQLALTVLVTWLIVDRIGLSAEALRRLDPSIWTPEPLLLIAASLLLLAGYFVSGAVWGVMVRDLGGPELPVRESVPMFMIANLGRYVPGKLWQIAALAALAKGRGVRPVTASGAAVLGHALALTAAAAVGLGALLAGPEALRPWGVAAGVVVGLVVVLAAVPPVFLAGARLWFRATRTPEPEALEGRRGLRWLALYALNWSVYALSFWVLVRSLGLEGPLLPVASAFAAAYVLGYAAFFAPAGLGPREGALIALLAPHFGVGPSSAAAIVARIWSTLVEVLPAAWFWTRRMRSMPGSGPSEMGSTDGRAEERGRMSEQGTSDHGASEPPPGQGASERQASEQGAPERQASEQGPPEPASDHGASGQGTLSEQKPPGAPDQAASEPAPPARRGGSRPGGVHG